MRDRNAYASLRDGLVGAWIPSVSGSGLLLPDLSGQGNNGTLTNMGPEDWVAGEYGRALDFDGSNDYVEIGYSKALDITGPITVSGWIKTTTTQSQVIYGGYQNVSPYPGLAVGLSIPGANAGRLVFWNGGSWTASTSTSYNSGEWTHVAVSYSGSSVSFYKNGFLDGVQAEGATTSWTGPRYLGVNLGAPNYLDGQLDDVRIYNRALSEPEIKLLSQEPGVGFKRTRSVFDFGRKSAYLPPTPTDYRTVRVKQTEHASLREGLVGAWCPSIEGDGYTLPDLSSNGNNGTLTNMGPEDYQTSHYGKTLYYDGSDATTIIGDVLDNVFVGTSARFTVSSWINLQSNGNCTIASKLGDTVTGGGNNRQWLFRCTAYSLDFAWYGNLSGTSVRVIRADDLIQDNVTTHVAATFDASVSDADLKVKLYINGILQSLSIPFTGGTPVSIPDGAARLSIGAAAGPIGGTISYEFIGQLDDIRIYNRVLSESEIKLLASRPGIGLRPQRRTMYYAPPTGARRRRILTSMP